MPKGISESLMTKIAIGVAILLSLLFLGIAVYERVRIIGAVEQKQQELTAYKNEGLGKLNSERVRLEKQLQLLQDTNKNMNDILFSTPISKMAKEVGDPLKFKEELYKVQNKIKEDGGAINFLFPFWLGFDKYEHDIPNAADLPFRIKQLDIIKEIGDIALAAKVPEISSIDYLEVKKITAEDTKELLYVEFPVKLVLKCKNENLINFLYKLSVANIPFKIDSFKIKVSGEDGGAIGELTAELVVVAAIIPADKT